MPKKIGKKERKSQNRLPEPRTFFIASEGIKTEVIYFRAFADKINQKYLGYENLVVTPQFKVEGMGTSNFRLITDVEDYLRKDPKIYENIWIVFDMDDIPVSFFDNSIKAAESKGYHVGWTNDSFELWYLLHMELLQSAISRKQYTEKLSNYLKREGIAKYEKNDEKVFEVLYPRTKTAIKNAEKLEASYEKSTPYSKRNPGTALHHLVKELVSLENEIEQIKFAEKYF